MTVMQKPKIKLTEHGKAVAEVLRNEKLANIERNNGEYVPDPWYKRYLSPDFVIKQNNIGVTDGYIEASAELGVDPDELEDEDALFDEDDDDYTDDED